MKLIATVLAPAWMIIIGGLMIIPRDGGVVIECIACGLNLTRILGVVTIVLGGAALAAGRRAGG